MRLITLLFVLLSSSSSFAQKRILMMIPDDFMWPEYSVPRRSYELAGFKVVTAAKSREPMRQDKRNIQQFPESRVIVADLTFEEVRIDQFDAITFVAGNGAWHDFFPNQTVHDLLREAAFKRKVVGLLCASTGLLALVGNWDGKTPIAAGKKVVGYFRVEGMLRSMGRVNFIAGGRQEPAVAVDGRLVTGRNWESSEIFARAVIQTLILSR